ncbi:hypothetical protein IWX90DRAFT_419219 [Phyllosticta citrichinensis]|uniref:Uncharacterized protein n=1 Tax=Phyllosticta citrichinensis TaxID=1130410 RepID=A0ABR1XFE0_9PEZI
MFTSAAILFAGPQCWSPAGRTLAGQTTFHGLGRCSKRQTAHPMPASAQHETFSTPQTPRLRGKTRVYPRMKNLKLVGAVLNGRIANSSSCGTLTERRRPLQRQLAVSAECSNYPILSHRQSIKCLSCCNTGRQGSTKLSRSLHHGLPVSLDTLDIDDVDDSNSLESWVETLAEQDPALGRALVRQGVLSILMQRTGALDRCRLPQLLFNLPARTEPCLPAWAAPPAAAAYADNASGRRPGGLEEGQTE